MDDSYTFLGKPINSPIYNAEGSINGTGIEEIIKHVKDLAKTGIGLITIGSVTIPMQMGNDFKYAGPGEVYYHNNQTGDTYNSMGLPNIGLEQTLLLLPELIAIASAGGQPLVVSVSPTLATPEIGDTFEQARRLVSKLINLGVIVIFNSSCPNIVDKAGGRKPILGYDIEGLERLFMTFQSEVGVGQNLGLKLPPYISEDELAMVPVIAKMIRESRVFKFVVTSNTIPNQVPKDQSGNNILKVPGGGGGLSGFAPRTIKIGRLQLQMWVDELKGSTEIISTLGVHTGIEVYKRVVEMGATIAGGVTVFTESSDWRATATKMLKQFANEF